MRPLRDRTERPASRRTAKPTLTIVAEPLQLPREPADALDQLLGGWRRA